MEVGKEVEMVQIEGTDRKKTYQQPQLVEHGQWTEKTLPPVGSTP